MNKRDSRSHKNRPTSTRQYHGFEDVYPLIAWLNHSTDEEGKERVLGLLGALRQVRELLDEPLFQHEGWYVEHHDSEPVVRYRALAKEIAMRCARYTYTPLISPPLNSPRYKWNTVWITTPGSDQAIYEARHAEKATTAMEEAVGSESVAIRALITAQAAEMLDRVLQCCHCGRWIFRKFKDQKACSTSCYQAEFKSNPQFKKERARQARERYRTKIILESGGKVAAKTIRKKKPKR